MSLINMPEHSRVWVFQANRLLLNAEEATLNSALTEFVAEWTAHGKELSAGFEIYKSAAVFVAVDESAEAPSGCSIDKVFRLLAAFGNDHNMDFLNRLLITVELESGIQIYSRKQALDAVHDKIIFSQTPTLNLQIIQLFELQNSPWLPFGNSWLGKTIPKDILA